MKVKNKIFKKGKDLNKNHLGNYQISVSFDIYGDKRFSRTADNYVKDIENVIMEKFKRCREGSLVDDIMRIDNVKWE